MELLKKYIKKLYRRLDVRELIRIIQKEGQLVVTSRQVAVDFEKRPSEVNRTIENLIIEITSVQNCTHLFIEDNYKDSYGRDQKQYLLTRDGFSLLVMGFTGSKALEWKLKYINAFNKMEKSLMNINSNFIIDLNSYDPNYEVGEYVKLLQTLFFTLYEDIKNNRRIGTEKINDIKALAGLKNQNTNLIVRKLKKRLEKIYSREIMVDDIYYFLNMKNLLEKFGVTRLKEIPMENYLDVFNYIETLEKNTYLEIDVRNETRRIQNERINCNSDKGIAK